MSGGNGVAVRSEDIHSYLDMLPLFLALWRAEEAAIIRDALRDVPPGARVLDLACGYGFFSEPTLTGLGLRVIGLDLRHDRLRVARRRSCFADVVQADATRLPFRAQSFDVITCNSAIEHFPDLQPIVAELRRVVRPAGRVVITTVTDRYLENCAWFHYLSVLRLHRLAALYRGLIKHGQAVNHAYDRESWLRLFRTAGLEPTTVRYYFSRKVTQISDLALPLGIPAGIRFKLLKRPKLLRYRFGRVRDWIERLVREDLARPDDSNASGIAFVAQPRDS
jgi:ubiquinone/menaquinone biosynthesis C-methylase UbiE